MSGLQSPYGAPEISVTVIFSVVKRFVADMRLEGVRGCTDAAGTSLGLESLLSPSECFNRAAASVTNEWLSPHESFYGSPPHFPVLPFLQPAYHRVP